jgi:hypothetical protein
MARHRRFTVRLEDREMQSIERFAERNHVITSVALRRLLEVGLAENNGQLQDVGRNTNASRPQQTTLPG